MSYICTSNNVHLTPNYFAAGVQFRSFSTEQVTLKSNKDTTMGNTLSFRTGSKESGKISEFLILGVNQDSFPKMTSGFADSIIVWSSAFLFFIDWQFISKILRGWFKAALGCLPLILASLGSCTIGEEAAGGGMIFGIRLSGSDREESESNWYEFPEKLWYQTVMWKSLAFHILSIHIQCSYPRIY